MKEKIINWLIKASKTDTNKISDGYHTFEQLYEHRIELWIKVCQFLDGDENAYAFDEYVWKTRTHSDGSKWKGWFILEYGQEIGKQITYHLPEKYWNKIKGVKILKKAPEFDGHTPQDVIKRLQKL